MILISTKHINREESTNNEHNESIDIDIENIYLYTYTSRITKQRVEIEFGNYSF